MPDPEIVRIAGRYRRELRSDELQAVKKLTASYRDLYTRTVANAARLQREIDTFRQAGEAVPAWRIAGMERYRDTMQQVERELVRVNAETLQTVKALQQEAIRAGVDMAEMQFASLTPASVGVTFNRLPTVALENMIGFLADGSPLSRLLNELGQDTAQRIGSTLVRGLGLGWNPRKTAKAIRQETGMGLTRSLRIARTEQLRAWRTSSIQGLRDQGATVKGFRRHAQKDARTCIACILEDGRFYAREEDFTDHVQGRCAVVPVTRSWEELGFPGIADTNPTWQTGREWFMEQDNKVQRSILGDPLYKAWEHGEIELDDMKYLHQSAEWGDSWQASSLKRARESAQAGGMGPLPTGPVTPPVVPTPPAPPPNPWIGKPPEGFTSLDDAHAWARGNYPDIEWDFTDADHTAIQDALKGFDANAKQYPEVAKRMKYVGTQRAQTGQPLPAFQSESVWAHAWRDRKDERYTIGLNPRWFGNRQDFLESIQRAAKVNWNPPGCDSIEYVITHEFGHHVDNWINMAGQEAAYHHIVRPTGEGLIGDTFAAVLKSRKATAKLSRYALTNEREAFAEAFASLRYTPKSQQTVYTKTVGKLLDLVGNPSKWLRKGEWQWVGDLQLTTEERLEVNRLLRLAGNNLWEGL